MWKRPKNPIIEELTKSHKERTYPISRVDSPKREDGSRGCVWCGDPLKTRHPNARYCKDRLCAESAYAWSNPQGPEGRHHLLVRQGFKCNMCQFDWKPYVEMAYQHGIKHFWLGWDRDGGDYTQQYIWWVWQREWGYLKLAKAHQPEVDHIEPIYKGGCSLGLENHQVICYTCHKKKTSKDLKK